MYDHHEVLERLLSQSQELVSDVDSRGRHVGHWAAAVGGHSSLAVALKHMDLETAYASDLRGNTMAHLAAANDAHGVCHSSC